MYVFLIHECMHVGIYISMYRCMYVYKLIYVNESVCIYIYVHMRAWNCVCMCILVYTYVYVCTWVYTYVSVCSGMCLACIYVYMYVLVACYSVSDPFGEIRARFGFVLVVDPMYRRFKDRSMR